MKYSDLINEWLSSRNIQGAPWIQLSPEDMSSYINAISPYDLWMRPDKTPPWINYPTAAMDYENKLGDSLPNLIAFVKGNNKRQLSPWYEAPENTKPYIMIHEQAHFQDPRLEKRRMWSFPNHGFTTYGGLTGNILQSEFPAMVAEDRARKIK